jgi:hypothetical protein
MESEFQATSTMHPLIAQKRSEIARVCRDHHVRRLEVFGSAARGLTSIPNAPYVLASINRARELVYGA